MRDFLYVNIQHEHARDGGLSFRFFETLACKTLLVPHGDARKPLTDLGFVEDEDYVAFDGTAELRSKCELYLADEDKRQAIAESGYRKVRAGHTLARRFADVFRAFGHHGPANRYELLSRTDVAIPFDAEEILKEKVTTLQPGHALGVP